MFRHSNPKLTFDFSNINMITGANELIDLARQLYLYNLYVCLHFLSYPFSHNSIICLKIMTLSNSFIWTACRFNLDNTFGLFLNILTSRTFLSNVKKLPIRGCIYLNGEIVTFCIKQWVVCCGFTHVIVFEHLPSLKISKKIKFLSITGRNEKPIE